MTKKEEGNSEKKEKENSQKKRKETLIRKDVGKCGEKIGTKLWKKRAETLER